MVAQSKASCHIPRKTWPSMVVPRCKLGISFLRSLLSDFRLFGWPAFVVSSTFSSPDAVPCSTTPHAAVRGLRRVTRYSYLDAKSNWSFAVSLRLTIPVPIRMMFRALHTHRHVVNRGRN